MTEEKNVPSSIQIEDKEKEIVYPNGDVYKGKMKNEMVEEQWSIAMEMYMKVFGKMI